MKKFITLSLLSLGVLSACNADLTSVDTIEISEQTLESQTNSEAMVTIEVAPRIYDRKEWVFDVSIATHSVELDHDLSKLATLIDLDGNLYENPGWEGDPPGGHHREGQLIFTELAVSPQFTLNLQNIAGIEDRIFTWSMSK